MAVNQSTARSAKEQSESLLSTYKCDEAGRLRALARLDILDSAPQPLFDGIVELVRQTINVPICAISLIDHDRQWFKAQRGLDVCETSREISFCTHAITATAPYIVVDATKNCIFKDNILVTGSPHIRSYIGIPLISDEGYCLGTLCAIDVVPRKFDRNEIVILGNFSKVVMANIELRQLASTDALTGIMSRRAWIDCADREVDRARRYSDDLSLLVLDVDNFKLINDHFGHHVGDEVLQGLALAIGAQLRRSDWFGRFGGEEFVVALPNTSLANAAILAERIRAAVAEMRIASLGNQACTISIGVAAHSQHEISYGEAFERADRALYLAKNLGRNRVQVADIADKWPAVHVAA